MDTTTNATVFGIALATMLKRMEVFRIDESESESDYLALSIESKDGAYAVQRGDQHLHTESTVIGDLVKVKITRYAYGKNTAQGATLISAITRYFQHSETRYITADLDENGNVRLHGIFSRTTKDGVTVWSSNKDQPLIGALGYNAQPITQEDVTLISALITRFITRAKNGAKLQDQRRELWNTGDESSRTAYGMYKNQTRAEKK